MDSKNHIPNQLVDTRLDKNKLDVSTFVVGKTRAVVNPPGGCCGNTICFEENLVLDKGTFVGQNGQPQDVVLLENGMLVTSENIQYSF
jgi:hypothetical protein